MRGDGEKFLKELGDVGSLPSRTQGMLGDFARQLERADRGQAKELGSKAGVLKGQLRSYAHITTDKFNSALNKIK